MHSKDMAEERSPYCGDGEITGGEILVWYLLTIFVVPALALLSFIDKIRCWYIERRWLQNRYPRSSFVRAIDAIAWRFIAVAIIMFFYFNTWFKRVCETIRNRRYRQ